MIRGYSGCVSWGLKIDLTQTYLKLYTYAYEFGDLYELDISDAF